ncbi:orotate phosphoribosyltransferase [Peptoniphilus raoultii]|uniref:orotate phosphoribosyltransferase n=1 Tax=Peptoniphilus raoultii TaxID=1776387 RepID=UPI0008D9C0F8|nr:orotate phosphoribosyltransferase [Peptoniphilus raoultii]
MKEIAKILLKIKAVSLSPNDPYTWASGIKSPIYCDNRLILSYPEEREIVENAFVDLIKNKFPDAEYIMGTATAGISHAAIIAQKMKLPMGYVRSKGKDHGKKNQIEGKILKGAKTVLIEDLFSTGGSSIDAGKALKEENFDLLGIVSVFTYNLQEGLDNFKNSNFSHYSLTGLDELLDLAKENGEIDSREYAKLLKFRENPKDESWIND